MAKRGTKAGDFYVEGHVDKDAIDSGMRNVRETVERETRTAGEAVDKNLGGGFKKVGQSIESSTEGIRKLVGSITSTVGIATGLLGVFISIRSILALVSKLSETIKDHYKEMASLAPALAEHLGKAAEGVAQQRNATAAEAAIRERLNTLLRERNRIEDAFSYSTTLSAKERLEALGVDFQEKSTRTAILQIVDEEIAKTDTQLSQLTARLGREKKIAEQLKEQTQQLKDQSQAYADFQFIPDTAEGIFNDAAIQENLNALRDEALKIEDEAASESLRNRLQILLDLNRRQMDDIRARWDEEDARAKRNAVVMADALSKALQGSSFGQNIAGPIEEMTRRLEAKLDSMRYGRRI